jgi:hypothetical protein
MIENQSWFFAQHSSLPFWVLRVCADPFEVKIHDEQIASNKNTLLKQGLSSTNPPAATQ